MTPLVYAALQGPEDLKGGSRLQEVFDQLLTFLYAAAHWFGQLVVGLLQLILGDAIPETTFDGLVDPIGFLILLTIFLALAEVAKKIAWLVVVVGWALILIRVLVEVFGGSLGGDGGQAALVLARLHEVPDVLNGLLARL